MSPVLYIAECLHFSVMCASMHQYVRLCACVCVVCVCVPCVCLPCVCLCVCCVCVIICSLCVFAGEVAEVQACDSSGCWSIPHCHLYRDRVVHSWTEPWPVGLQEGDRDPGGSTCGESALI